MKSDVSTRCRFERKLTLPGTEQGSLYPYPNPNVLRVKITGEKNYSFRSSCNARFADGGESAPEEEQSRKSRRLILFLAVARICFAAPVLQKRAPPQRHSPRVLHQAVVLQISFNAINRRIPRYFSGKGTILVENRKIYMEI